MYTKVIILYRVHCAISTCHLHSQNPKSALAAATKAVEIDKQEPMCWMAKMHAERANRNFSAAIEDAHHIAQLDPDLGRDLPKILQQLQSESHVPRNQTRNI